MKFKFTFVTILMTLLAMSISCSTIKDTKNTENSNIVFIDSTDTKTDIVRKAANVRPSDKQLAWQKYELTAFFHYGINTFTGREWGTGKEDPAIFDPSDLDVDQWVKTMKDAGFKLAILTAKHHDGFCLWPSSQTEYSIKNSPYKGGKGDIVKEFTDACKKHGIKAGIYLSPWDMNHATYGDSPAYNEVFRQQLTELLSNYGPIDEVWFDGANGEGPNGKTQEYDFPSYYKLINELQPHAVIAIMGPDIRWVGTETGYGRLTEWSVVPTDGTTIDKVAAESQNQVGFAPKKDLVGEDLGSRDVIQDATGLVWYPAETDVSIRQGWFYHEEEQPKSLEKLIDIYVSSVGRNGVLLLNVPPDKRGRVHEADSLVLAEFGKVVKEVFSNNLIKDAQLAGDGENLNALMDNDFDTYFTTKSESDTTASLEFMTDSPVQFNAVQLQEYIALGQRVESFVVEYWDDDQWKLASEGTTIGYKRILTFESITSSKVRLRITSSRLNPRLSSFGLFKMPTFKDSSL